MFADYFFCLPFIALFSSPLRTAQDYEKIVKKNYKNQKNQFPTIMVWLFGFSSFCQKNAKQ